MPKKCNKIACFTSKLCLLIPTTSKTYGQNLRFGQFPICSSYIWPLDEYIGNFYIPPLNKIVTLTMPSLLSLTEQPLFFFAKLWFLPPFGRVSPSLGQIYFFCPSLYPGVHGYCEGEVSNLYQSPSCLARHMASAFTIFPANCSKLTHPHSIPTNLVCVVVYNDVYSFSDVHVLLPGHWHLSYLSPTQLRPSSSGHAPATAKPGGMMMLLWHYRARSSPTLVWKNMSKT